VAHGRNSTAFAVAYVVLRSIMLLLYWRAWLAVREARALVRFYGLGYSAGVALWLLSLLFPTPWRYGVWVVAQLLELSLPPLSTQLHRRIPTSPRHLPERWALFTLIVLGESVVAVAIATAGAHWHFTSAAAAVLGFASVAAIWWLYFDRQSEVVLRGSTMSIVVYSYAHLPLLIGLAAMSAGLRLLIEHGGDDHLGAGASVAFLGGAALFVLSLIATRLVTVQGPHRRGAGLKLTAAGGDRRAARGGVRAVAARARRGPRGRPRGVRVRRAVRLDGRYLKMLTARAATSSTTRTEIADSNSMRSFAQRLSGIASVGLNAIEFVNETYM
ncbi:MAG TPA: low temperature requirement protein A, partial [Myxococcales bacterium]|nr:low temperature requirement protein A [Myxococcales bacterium]